MAGPTTMRTTDVPRQTCQQPRRFNAGNIRYDDGTSGTGKTKRMGYLRWLSLITVKRLLGWICIPPLVCKGANRIHPTYRSHLMFKTLRILGVAAALSILSVSAQAGDPFRSTANNSSVSANSLDLMGLGGMQELSHDEANQIRGQGFIVWGSAIAYARNTVGSQTKTSSYSLTGSTAGFGSTSAKAQKFKPGTIAIAGGYSYTSGYTFTN